ncbi:MAG TPA: OmpA family protein, partial [Segetibacter sp.]
MINTEARSVLNKFIASGKINSVGFFGHTDQSGRAEYNEWLSVQRALAVKDYLLSKGLKEDKVSVVRGFGAERLITTAPDSASQQLNRRVAITSGYKPTPTDIAAQIKQTPIYYSSSPTLPKDLADSSTVSLTTDTKQPVASNKT